MEKVFETYSPEETLEIGKLLGENAAPGEVYALIGDLGAGKTVFTKGFAQGLGIEEPEEMEEVGFDEYIDGDGVCLIEWAGRIGDLLPPEVIVVRIEKNLDRGPDYRRITVRH